MQADLKAQGPAGLIDVKAGVNRDSREIETECVQEIRDQIGAVASLRAVMTVPRLPKTRSGKILRGTMRKIADSEEWTMPATIDDPAILDEIAASLRQRGVAR